MGAHSYQGQGKHRDGSGVARDPKGEVSARSHLGDGIRFQQAKIICGEARAGQLESSWADRIGPTVGTGSRVAPGGAGNGGRAGSRKGRAFRVVWGTTSHGQWGATEGF